MRAIGNNIARNVARHVARGGYSFAEWLQEIYFDSVLLKHQCKGFAGKNGLQPVLNNIPVYAPTTLDVLNFIDLEGITIVNYEGTAIPVIVGNQIQFTTSGTFYHILLSDGTFIRAQNYGGDRAWSSTNNNHATLTGSGIWWTRVDDVVSLNQARGFKLVTLTNDSEIYIERNISDAAIEAYYADWFSTVTLLQDGFRHLNDGSLLDLNATVCYVPLAYGEENITDGDMSNAFAFLTNARIENSIARFIAAGVNVYLIQYDIWPVNSMDGKWVMLQYEVVYNTLNTGKLFLSGYTSSDFCYTMYVPNIVGVHKIPIYVNGAEKANNLSMRITPASTNGVLDIAGISLKEITTISDYFNKIETDSAINLNAIHGGQLLPELYEVLLLQNNISANHSGVVGVFTESSYILSTKNLIGIKDFHVTLHDVVTDWNGSSIETLFSAGLSIYIKFLSTSSIRYQIYDGTNIAVGIITVSNDRKPHHWGLRNENNVLSLLKDGIVLSSVNSSSFIAFPSVVVKYGDTLIGTMSKCKIESSSVNESIDLNGKTQDSITGALATNNGVTFESLNKVSKNIRLPKP